MNRNIFDTYDIGRQDAQIIVDLQKTFSENRENEPEWALRVPNTQGLDVPTNQAVEYFKSKGGIILASIEEHDQGHISFASSFKNKIPIIHWVIKEWEKGINPIANPECFITYEEVKNWTETNNWLTNTAAFTVEELQAFLEIRWTEAMWPDHAVKDTFESEFITGFNQKNVDEIFTKWDDIAEHTYSAFAWVNQNGVPLAEYMHEKDVERTFVSSLATDFCVRNTALDSVKEWFNTHFVEVLSRGVYEDTTKEALEEMQDHWVTIIKA